MQVRPRPGLIFLFFFSSGFAALLYQVVWLKYLNLLFGSTTYATAAVLSAFMFGLSFGSRVSPKLRFLFRNSLRSYGLMEAGVGIFAALFPWLYSVSTVPFAQAFNIIGPQSFWYSIFVFFVAFLALLVPTSLMGATLPLLANAVIGRHENIAGKMGILYAANTIGAVAGILCSAFLLIPRLGLQGTIFVGVIINLAVGLICFLSRDGQDHPELVTPQQSQGKSLLLSLYLVSGLLALGYEVLWTRILVLHLGSSVYAYAIMLAVFLVGISAGSATIGRWLDRRAIPPEPVFAALQIAWAFSILLQIIEFSQFSNLLYALASPFSRLSQGTYFVVLLIGTLLVLFLPTFLSGALFPVVVKALWERGSSIETATSFAYGYNTIGGVFGSVVAGFLLIPLFGTQTAMIIFAGANLCLGVIAAIGRVPFYKLGMAMLVFVAAAVLLQGRISLMKSAGIFASEGGEHLISMEEDSASTITVERRMYMGQPYNSLSVNAINVAGSSPQLVTIQKMQGNIPMILYGPEKPARVLHIGFGSGGTAYSVSLFPQSDIQVVELSRAIVRNANKYFRSENHGIVESGKLEITYFDGRSFLQNTTETYDVILSDSIHPRSSGNGVLYTRNYYELVKKHLRPGGVHSQWIPTYSLSVKNLKEIVRAFWEVFPETYVWYVNSSINPYIVITGQNGQSGISLPHFQQGLEINAVRKDLNTIDILGAYHILDYFLFGPDNVQRYVQDVDPHTDDRLTVEYESARIMNKQASWWFNFDDLLKYREPISRYLKDPGGLDTLKYNRFYEATGHNLKGQNLFLLGKRKEAAQLFSTAVLLNPEDSDPMEYSKIGF